VGGDQATDPRGAREKAHLTALLDTNVLVRHLTGDPPEQTERARAYLNREEDLLLTDLVVAELVYVLESNYKLPRSEIGGLVGDMLELPSVVVGDASLIGRALDVYDTYRIDFAEAYLVACAERDGIGVIASFDRSLDRVPTIRRLEPA